MEFRCNDRPECKNCAINNANRRVAGFLTGEAVGRDLTIEGADGNGAGNIDIESLQAQLGEVIAFNNLDPTTCAVPVVITTGFGMVELNLRADLVLSAPDIPSVDGCYPVTLTNLDDRAAKSTCPGFRIATGFGANASDAPVSSRPFSPQPVPEA